MTGYFTRSNLVEIIELPDHPWFLGCQFHPEFTSRPMTPHPLFTHFIEAGLAYAKRREWEAKKHGTPEQPSEKISNQKKKKQQLSQ